MKTLILTCLLSSLFFLSEGQERKLTYAPAPADNPLKGFVPYVDIDAWERFPHSLQFHYFSFRELMTGPDSYDWSLIDEKLQLAQERGCQLTFRVMAEYPGRSLQIPEFLVERGVTITAWKDPEGKESFTPDYEHPEMRKALVDFIKALGARYDGDPRVGYLTAGLLGSWGEWHNYPREDLWASHETQALVLDAFEAAFTKTPVLLRYPAGEGHYAQTENTSRRFGYHDDSFDWATLETGREEDSWFFMHLLREAGALEKWKRQPIGGELRPELWETSFTDSPHPKAQGFDECVKISHVTWLMDTGLFSERFPLSENRRRKAIEAARSMGYEFHVSSWERNGNALRITVKNTGVAPFYHDWPVELRKIGGEGLEAQFDLRDLLPGEEREWKAEVEGEEMFLLRVPNPMEGGRPLRFANAEQDEDSLYLR